VPIVRDIFYTADRELKECRISGDGLCKQEYYYSNDHFLTKIIDFTCNGGNSGDKMEKTAIRNFEI
jgi:hypothetical protein